jgi:hypothetical protein
MDHSKISLSSLLNKNTESIGNVSIKKINDFEKKNKNVDIKEIFEIKEKQDKEKIKVYQLYYRKCIEHIKTICNSNKNETIFEVPKCSNLNPNYNFDECLSYIMQNLEKNNFYIVCKNNIIFITWKYINFK